MLKLYAMKDGILGYGDDLDHSIVACRRQKKTRGKQRANASLTPDNSQRMYAAVLSRVIQWKRAVFAQRRQMS